MSDNVRTRPLFELKLLVKNKQFFGTTPIGDRRVVVILGGHFEGDRLKGKVVEEGGADWLIYRPDRALQLDVRLTLRTDDDQLIGMTYRGFRHGSPDLEERLTKGENPDPSTYYFRSTAFFETAAPKYDWLNRIVTVGIGAKLPEGPVYRMFEVL